MELFEDSFQGGTFADDFFEVVFRANLVLQVELLLAQCVGSVHHPAKGQRGFDRNGDLIGDVLQELRVLLRESFILETRDDQGAQGTIMRDQRQATCGLKPLVQDAPGNIRPELLDVTGGYKHGLACRQSPSRRRTLDGHPKTFLKHSFTDGEIQRVNLQTLGFGVIERKTCVFMRHQTAQRCRDCIQQLVQVEHGDHCVVNLEQYAQAVALLLELLLDRLYLLEVKSVVQRNRDLSSDLLQEDYIEIRIGRLRPAAECQRTQFPQRRRHRNDAERVDAAIAEPTGQVGKLGVVAEIGDDPGLLRLPDPTPRRLHRALSGGTGVSGIRRFQDTGLQRLQCRVV